MSRRRMRAMQQGRAYRREGLSRRSRLRVLHFRADERNAIASSIQPALRKPAFNVAYAAVDCGESEGETVAVESDEMLLAQKFSDAGESLIGRLAAAGVGDVVDRREIYDLVLEGHHAASIPQA